MRDIEIFVIVVIGEERGADAGIFSNAYRSKEAAVKFLKEENFKPHNSDMHGAVYETEECGGLYVKIEKIDLLRD